MIAIVVVFFITIVKLTSGRVDNIHYTMQLNKNNSTTNHNKADPFALYKCVHNKDISKIVGTQFLVESYLVQGLSQVDTIQDRI
jgi:hypothetical protein